MTFPAFVLEDKDNSKGGAIVAGQRNEEDSAGLQQHGTLSRHSERKNQGQIGNKFKDFWMGN